ncbi:MAG: hypothetical protein AB1505_11390 [Candidatus Latescibacterota bacterium]
MSWRSIAQIALAVPMVVWLAGCDKPPEEQITATKAAVDATVQAEAAKYAAPELAQLQDSLKAALAEVDRQNARFIFLRDYAGAKATLTWVGTRAPQVAQTAKANKEKMRAATQQAIETAQAAVDSAAALLAAAPRGKESKQDMEAMEAEITSLRAGLDEARAGLAAEDFNKAKVKAQDMQTRALEIQNEVAAVIQKYEELMAKRRGRRG